VWAAIFAIPISSCRSLLQSFEDTFLELELVTVENPTIKAGILTLSIPVPEIHLCPVSAAILLFPVFGRWHNHYGHFRWTRYCRKLQNCHWNFDAINISSRVTRQSYCARYWYRLDVCQSVCPSHAGIVSKRLNLYRQTVFTAWYSPMILVFEDQTFSRNSNGNTPTGAVKCKGIGKSCNFWPISRNSS